MTTTTDRALATHLCVCGHPFRRHSGLDRRRCRRRRCACIGYVYRNPQPPVRMRAVSSKTIDNVLMGMLLVMLAVIVLTPVIQSLLTR